MFGKIDMLQIPQSEIYQLLWRSLGRKMEDSIQILAEHRASIKWNSTRSCCGRWTAGRMIISSFYQKRMCFIK